MYGLWGNDIASWAEHLGQASAPGAVSSRDEDTETNNAVAEEDGGGEDDEYNHDGEFAAGNVVGES